jgi:GT2 family glycosyltransferase
MLDECLDYLEARATAKSTYEVIIVSDGSKDKTVDVALSYSKKYGSEKVRVLELVENRGKGGAVRLVGAKLYRFHCLHKSHASFLPGHAIKPWQISPVR